jgi:plasmid stabilization system protein ParE
MAKKSRGIWSLESSRKIQSILEYLLDEWGEKEAKAFLKRLKKI